MLTRFAELGFHVADGRLLLAPGLIPAAEILPLATDGEWGTAEVTVCAVPMSIETGTDDAVVLELADGTVETHDGLALGPERSRDVFARTGAIARVRWIVGDTTASTWRHRSSPA